MKRKKGSTAKSKRPERWFVNDDGVQCVETTWENGESVVFKISDPREPFFQNIKRDLADIPPLNLHETISELRD